MRTLDEVLAAHPPPFPPDKDGNPQTLKPLQREDTQQLAELGEVLGDLPVGYGKTAMGTYATLMIDPDVTIIIVPPILIVSWVLWLRAVPGIGTVIAYEGTPAKRNALMLRSAKWIVMSYGIFRNDFDRLVDELQSKRVHTVVDEAQAIKNHRSALFKAVRAFTKGRTRFKLSGTPVSKPSDVYAYVKLNNPDIYATYAQFEQIHVAERDFFDQPVKWRELDLMQENFRKGRIYRSKEEVHAHLPKANFIPVYYDLDKEHMALYRRLMTEQLLELEDGTKIDATTAQRLYHHAQQIITNWGYFAGDDTKKARVFDLIDNVCDEIGLGDDSASKLILWTQYKMTSAAVHAYMSEKAKGLGGRAVAAYSGADSVKSVAAFMNDPKTYEMTAQPGSAGAGLNPQYVCWECAFIETPTRTIHFIQSSGRIDREGQKYNPNIRLFIARGTVQEGLLANLLSNDDEVVAASGTKTSIRNLIFPK